MLLDFYVAFFEMLFYFYVAFKLSVSTRNEDEQGRFLDLSFNPSRANMHLLDFIFGQSKSRADWKHVVKTHVLSICSTLFVTNSKVDEMHLFDFIPAHVWSSIMSS